MYRWMRARACMCELECCVRGCVCIDGCVRVYVYVNLNAVCVRMCVGVIALYTGVYLLKTITKWREHNNIFFYL